LGGRNYWTDECLVKAGGKANGVMDFWQIHSYAYNGKFNSQAPFEHEAKDYGLDRPIVVGEFNDDENHGGGHDSEWLYNYVYRNGY